MGLSGAINSRQSAFEEHTAVTTPSAQLYREIKLTQGQVALVDAEDYERLSKHKWFAMWAPNTQSFYAGRKVTSAPGKQRGISMHRVVLGLKDGDPRQGEHAFHNTLDNRKFIDGKANLRISTCQQNNFNRPKNRASTSGYKGVHWRNDRNRWRAEIRIDGKLIYLGLFKNPEDASKAYNTAAERLHGEFAYKI